MAEWPHLLQPQSTQLRLLSLDKLFIYRFIHVPSCANGSISPRDATGAL